MEIFYRIFRKMVIFHRIFREKISSKNMETLDESLFMHAKDIIIHPTADVPITMLVLKYSSSSKLGEPAENGPFQ
jgi:hypothetical protein